MREILFRGKDNSGVLNHSWCFGSLDTTLNEQPTIIYPDRFGNHCKIIVKEHTIGQYIGLTDKNGKKIFEGDVVKVEGFIEPSFIVIYYNGGFKLKEIGSPELFAYYITETMVEEELIEAIGNIHDNPELVKGGEG